MSETRLIPETFEEKEAVDFLLGLLSVRSVNSLDDEGSAAEFLGAYFAEAGIASEVLRIDPKHADITALLPGKSRKKMIWNGHLDTVPYGDPAKWHTDPAVPAVKDGRIYARGASDMKSGLAAMAFTLAELKRQGRKPENTICFFGTCDEEKGGSGAAEILKRKLLPKRGDLLIGEPTGLGIGVAQKGCVWLSFTVHGKTSHGAYPEKGINAVSYAYRIAGDLKKEVEKKKHPLLKKATAEITEISGGVAPNMVPDCCRVLMDIRILPGTETAEILYAFDRISERYREKTGGILSTEREIKNERRAVEISPEDPFAEALRKRIYQEENRKPRNIGINYFTDASVFLKAGERKVLLFGPGEPELCHREDEYVIIQKYLKAIRILMAFAGNGAC